MLWEPVGDNENEIFNIRAQIYMGLVGRRNRNSRFYFDNVRGKPVMPGIVHTTFMRPLDVRELQDKFASFREVVARLNERIDRGALFAETLDINEIAFIEEHIDNNVEVVRSVDIPKFYQVEVLERREAV